MEIKDDRMYLETHEWVRFEDEATAAIGISDYAQRELGDLVFVSLPQPGDSLAAGETFADVESVKAVSDLYSPVSGMVEAVNEELADHPEKINAAPYETWLCRVSGITGKAELMTGEEYEAFLHSLL